MNTEEKTEIRETEIDETKVESTELEGTENVNDGEQYGNPEPAALSNPITGIIGALVGSILGVVLWVVIYHMGYIASIAGLAIIFCALKGYEILGRSLDKKGVVISSVIALVMVFVANHMAWTYEFYVELKDWLDMTFVEMFKIMPDLIKEADAVKEYLSDLGFGYVLTLIGGVSTIINKFKSAK